MTPAIFDGACDCHVHIYEPGYALATTATFTPPDAPLSAYRTVQQALGLRRAVIVQPTGYGFDNACTLAAVAGLGADGRAVVVVPPDVSDAELERLHAAGARGIRFMMLAGGLLPWDALEPLAARVAPLGWHIDLQFDGRDMPLHAERLRRLPGRLVVDHIGKFLGPATPDDAAFGALRRLLDAGRCWIKIAAPYETSRTGPPGYADVAPLAQALAAHHAERCLWASNWPHPNVLPRPDNRALLDWALACIGDTQRAQRILVDNPAALYGF